MKAILRRLQPGKIALALLAANVLLVLVHHDPKPVAPACAFLGSAAGAVIFSTKPSGDSK